MRRVQEEEALQEIKVRILSARHADGGSGDGGAEGMLIDKPGEDGPEQHDSAGLEGTRAAEKPVPKPKTKQQRRTAERLRAEVRGQAPLPLPSSSSRTTFMSVSSRMKHYY